MVITSGIVTSRTSFSFGSFEVWPLSRWVRRRNDATERSRTSSARSAVTSVRRPRCFSTPARGAGRGAAAGRAGAAGRRDARALLRRRLRARAWRRARALGFFLAEALLGDFVGLALGFFVVLAAVVFLALARFGGFALGPVDRLRGSARRRASSSAILRSSASRTRAVGERMGARTALFFGERAQHDAGRFRRVRARQAPARRGGRFRRGGALRRFDRRGLRPWPRALRRSSGVLTFSTTTCLLRPWLKLWRTTPVSVRGLQRQLLTLSFFSPGFFVSLIP